MTRFTMVTGPKIQQGIRPRTDRREGGAKKKKKGEGGWLDGEIPTLYYHKHSWLAPVSEDRCKGQPPNTSIPILEA